jgi:hypothetical protein
MADSELLTTLAPIALSARFLKFAVICGIRYDGQGILGMRGMRNSIRRSSAAKNREPVNPSDMEEMTVL